MIFKRHKEIKFISRKKAAELLGINIKELHELCILTNTKPVRPKNRHKFDHDDTLFYLIADIQGIVDSHVFSTLQSQKWVINKRNEHIKNHRYTKAENLFDVEHNYVRLVEERYASLSDALIGLNGSLDVLFAAKNLFAADFDDALGEWKEVVQRGGLLSSVFVSQKGYYYLIRINRIQILWIEPHAAEENLSICEMSDFQVLCRFAYYHLKLVLRKLQSMNLTQSKPPALFSGKTFFLEKPNEHLQYVIRFLCGGIQQTHDKFDFYVTDSEIRDFDPTNVYVQPQFVFDCFNGHKVLNVGDYTVGKTLPEHKCPFVKNESFKVNEKLFALMSKTKQKQVREFIEESKY